MFNIDFAAGSGTLSKKGASKSKSTISNAGFTLGNFVEQQSGNLIAEV